MTPGYRVLPHPSDVGVEAWGPDFASALDQAVRGLADIECGGLVPAPTEERPLPPVPEDEDGLVLALERCLLELDADGWLAVGVRDGALAGTPMPDTAREAGTHVKAVTWHQLAVTREVDGVRAVVYLDL
jgi:SHS2 domain-containing protein